MQTIRVMVVDDHEMVAEGLARLLSAEPRIDVVGRAATAHDSLAMAARLRPDVVVMDYRLPDGDGVAAARDILAASPDTEIVMVTASDHPAIARAALEAGCKGFVSKDRAARDVVGAVHAVARGDMVAPADAVRARAEGRPRGAVGLTPREVEVLQLLAEGMTTTDIAEMHFLSVSTVRNHVQRVLGKLGVRSQLEAVAVGLREGIVRPPE